MQIFRKKINIKSLIPEGFTDVHSHTLPGIDDGAKTIEDSLAMIKKFKELGVNKIVATPHVMGGVWPNTKEIILKKLTEVKENLLNEKVTDFSIKAAAEYMLDENFIELLEKKDLLPIEDNKVLVEMSCINPPPNLLETIFFMQISGYKPVLAHPERYAFYHSDTDKYNNLKNLGTLFQLNLLSLTNYYGKQVQKTAFYLLENNLYDYAASDAHNLRQLEQMSFILSKRQRSLLEKLIQNQRNKNN